MRWHKPHWRHQEHIRVVLSLACGLLAIADIVLPDAREWTRLASVSFTLIWIWET